MNEDYTPEQRHRDEGWFMFFGFIFIILMFVVNQFSRGRGFYICWGLLFAAAATHWLVIAVAPRFLTRWRRYRHVSTAKARRFSLAMAAVFLSWTAFFAARVWQTFSDIHDWLMLLAIGVSIAGVTYGRKQTCYDDNAA